MQSRNLNTLMFILVCIFLAGGIINRFFWIVASLGFAVFFFIGVPYDSTKLFQNKKYKIIDIAILFVCVSELCSGLFSIYKPNSISYTLSVFLIASLWFFVRQFVLCERQWHYLEISMSALTLVLSIITIITFYTYKHHLSAFSEFELTDFKREYTPLGIPINDWTTFLICLLPYPVQCAIKSQRRRNTVGFVCIMAIQLASILLSLSRGAYVALFCFYLTTVFFICIDKYESRKKTVVMASALLIAGIIVLPNLHEIAITCSMSNTVSQRQSTEGRKKLIKDIPALWQQAPFTGVGGNNFNIIYDSTVNDRLAARTRPTNFYLLTLLEKGIIGFSAYLFLIISVVAVGLRNIHNKGTSSFYLAVFVALCIRAVFFTSINRYDIIMSWIVMLMIGIGQVYKEDLYE